MRGVPLEPRSVGRLSAAGLLVFHHLHLSPDRLVVAEVVADVAAVDGEAENEGLSGVVGEGNGSVGPSAFRLAELSPDFHAVDAHDKVHSLT